MWLLTGAGASRTSSSRHLQFLATQHPSPLSLDLAGGRVLSKNCCASVGVDINPPVHVPDVIFRAGAGNSWLLHHDGAEGTAKLQMCYLNLTGCHLYPYPVTMSITTVSSLRGSVTNALAPVLNYRAGLVCLLL